MKTNLFLQAALNGDRVHPSAPRTPEQMAIEARAAVAAGAQSTFIPIMSLDTRPSMRVIAQERS
jgi:uncharacterized protein (DUF849 family)